MHRIPAIALASSLLLFSTLACAQREVEGDTLLVDRVQQARSLEMPTRGVSMAQVESRYGAPMQRLDPRGGQKPQWPVINRWVYPEFTVYFEHSHVVDVVARKANALEIAPKPVR